MKILALDCAGTGCSVCVWKDGRVLSLVDERMERGQDARLIPMVQEALANASVTYPDLDRIAVTRGPGSFTGLRIGLAAARGIGLAAQKPVVGIDRFAVYAAGQKESKEPFLVVLESRRLELYVCHYPRGTQADEPCMMTPEEIAQFVATREGGKIKVVGDAQGPLTGFVDPALLRPALDSESVVCAALAARTDLQDPAFLPRPLYLRPPDVTIKPCET